MGQKNNSPSLCKNANRKNHKTVEDLIYYIKTEDSQFGEIKVYSSSKRPSSYVAKVEKTVENSKIYSIFEQIENRQVGSLASMHAFEITRQKYCTGRIAQKITVYWEYYNYSFESFIRMRNVKRMPLNQNQIWLIVKSCCECYSIFNFHQLVLDLDLSHIMIIPEGKIKIYWHYVELGNTHLKFHKQMMHCFEEKNLRNTSHNPKFQIHQQKQMDTFFFSPEEIEAIQKRQQTMRIDFTRSNSFRLGMILLYCITLTNPIKTCYGFNNSTGEIRIKLVVLNSLYENHIENSPKYSDDLKHLIRFLLLENPKKRIPLDCIPNIYEKFLQTEVQLAMGMNQNPLFAPSSSRKNLKQLDVTNNLLEQNKTGAKSFSLNPKNSSKLSSEKKIQLSRIKNQKEQESAEYRLQSKASNEYEIFDKFDTKTIKIASSYHKK